MPIDPAYREFLADPRNTVLPPPAGIPLYKVRRVADKAMSQGAFVPLPRVEDGMVDCGTHAVHYRLYHPAGRETRPVIFFFHGGGFVWGSVETHDGICRRLARRTDAAVISIDYRLSPETRFPGARDDGLAVIDRVLSQADALAIDPACFALCGDSAGGQIAISVCAWLVGSGPKPRHLSLFYPTVDPACDSASQTDFAEGPLLTRSAMIWFWECYLGGTSPSAVQVSDDLLSRFPQTHIVTAENDPLRDEGEAFAEHLRSLQVPVATHRAPGLIHGFLSLGIAPEAVSHAFSMASDAIRTALLS